MFFKQLVVVFLVIPILQLLLSQRKRYAVENGAHKLHVHRRIKEVVVNLQIFLVYLFPFTRATTKALPILVHHVLILGTLPQHQIVEHTSRRGYHVQVEIDHHTILFSNYLVLMRVSTFL